MKLPLLSRIRYGAATEVTPGGRTRRGQSLVEVAMLAPILVVLLSIVIECGLALNAWIRVNTAARDATRFALDAGPHDQAASLVLQKLSGIDFGSAKTFTGSQQLDVFIITGTTGLTGTITTWGVDHRYDGNSDNSTYRVQRSAIQAQLLTGGTSAAASLKF